MDFQYRITVIVPVYNVEEYLRECLDSLVAQTIEHDQVEVLLINDGSIDNSLAICREYAENHSMFKVFDKENEGVSITRNFGIRNAKGKFITYLDSDDTITEKTLELLCNFFDKHYDKTDVVTYKEVTYNIDGTPKAPHYRYDFLKESGIYDLKNKVFCSQTLINIVVKNLGEDNIYFDEKIGYHEDQMYCNQLLNDKMTLGYVAGCEYRYNKHEGSISEENMNALFLFEKTTAYWEFLFNQYEVVPQYFQALFFNDLRWKIRANVLFPYQYDGEQFDHAVGRIKKLLDKVDDAVIMNFPSVNNFHKHYFLNLKSDRNKATVIANYDSIKVQKNGLQLYKNKKMEIILSKLNVFNDELCICAHLKSPVFNYIISEPKIVAEITTQDGSVITKEMDKYISYDSYYLTREKTNNFYGFEFVCDIKNIAKLKFKAIVDQVSYDCCYYFMTNAPFSKALNKYRSIFNNCTIEFKDNTFYVEQTDSSIEREKANLEYQNKGDVYRIRSSADALRDKQIWLYYDCSGVEKDNGYYQFMHDFDKNDGIIRYYVTGNGDNTNYELFSTKQISYIVHFGSERHKILYLAAEKIITAFIEDRNIIPFSKEELPYYCDVAHPQVIYLQHGILHAHLPWKYSPGKILADKIVVSSYFELDSFTNNYNFRKENLIPSGMPRFDHIDTSVKPINRILFAPSWRNYLTKEDKDRGWIINDKKFMASDYYIKFNDFLNSERLGKFLEEKDLYLDFKIHPIFEPFLHCFENKNPRVSFTGSSVDDSEYALFITDFSSFVFDFAYLKRPIIYFVPDMPQFKSGMNLYRELDLPFEKAFGNLTTEPEDSVNEVIRIVENGFALDPVFKERLDNFFLALDNCEENLYKYLMEENK